MGMDVAWRINTPDAVPCNKAAAAGAGGDLICLLSTEFGLVEFSRAGLPRLYCDLRCLCAKELNANTRCDTRAELGGSGRPDHYHSGSIMCSIIRHRLSTATATRHCIDP